MKKKLFPILFSVILTSFTNAQQNTFSKVLSGEHRIQVSSLTKSYDSGYIIVGDQSDTKGLIIKLDSECIPQWNKIYKNYSSSYPGLRLKNIIRTKDSCYFISGNIYNESTDKQNAIGIKINRQGQVIWKKTINYNQRVSITGNIQTADSGVIITGTNNSNKIVAAKLDFNGNIQWSKVYSSGTANTVYSIKQLPDQNYIIVGDYYSSSNDGALLIKISEEGNLLWAKRYYINDYTAKANGFIIINNKLLLYINTEGIITLLKTDFSGNIIWKKSYITWGWGNSNNLTAGLLFSSNNHYIFVFGNEMLMSSGIIETDTTGSIIFSNELILNPSGITETDNNEYLIYGNGPVYGEKNINSSNENIGLIQIDSTGNEQDCMWATTSDTTNIDFISEAIDFNVTDEGVLSHIPIDIYSDDISVNTGCIYVYGSIEYNENITNVIISPNPGFGNYNVEISIPLYGNFTVYNCFGQIVYQTSVNGKNFNFDISKKANGVYFFKLLSNNKIYQSGKFFKISK